jgi:hypothetical protein
MADHDLLPAPETPEWTVGWAIKRALRLHLGPRHTYLPWIIARDVVAALKLSNWRVTKARRIRPTPRLASDAVRNGTDPLLIDLAVGSASTWSAAAVASCSSPPISSSA